MSSVFSVIAVVAMMSCHTAAFQCHGAYRYPSNCAALGTHPVNSRGNSRALQHTCLGADAAFRIGSPSYADSTGFDGTGIGSYYCTQYYNRRDREEVDLSYLRTELEDLPPKTENLLKRVTSYYVNKHRTRSANPIALDEILNVIAEEYIFDSVPFSVGGSSMDKRNSNCKVTSMILSFAALHRLPIAISMLLLETDDSVDSVAFRAQFESWKSVSFPEGLAVRVKRNLAPSRKEKFCPVPRRLIKRKAAEKAEIAVREASTAKPPARKLSRQDLVAMMEKAKGLSAKSSFLSATPERFQDLNFFPVPSNGFFNKISRTASRLAAKFKAVGRGGVIAYGFLNFVWYTIAILVQWRRDVSSEALVASTAALLPKAAVGASLRKFGKVFLSAYVGAQVTKLPRLYAAVALAPSLGNSSLRFTERRLQVSEAAAFWIVTGLLISSCLSIWAVLVAGDVFLLAQ